jgi:uracil-DNA glycosylase family protein
MSKTPAKSAADFLPPNPNASLPLLRRSAQKCRGCDLYKNATQAVFGQGAPAAKIMLIGEQPGDQEDLQGHPFVGPAGKLLDRALANAGIQRSDVYITNAVKHFKWTPAPRGKRRIHAKPSAREVQACLPWLKREISLIKPQVIVCLGATAAQSLLGSAFRLTKSRGQFQRNTPRAPAILATPHPSAILRAPDPTEREKQYQALVQDLKLARLDVLKK